MRLTFGDVEVEEVGIEQRLYDTSDDSNGIKVAIVVIAVDPVDQIHGSVQTKRKQIVARDVFSLPGLAHHEQLR